jgi:uncharacterized damage-inducible protein DinB
MRKTDLLTLFDYLAWLREQVMSAAGELTTDAFTANEAVTARDLRATLVHVIDVEASWRARLTAATSDPSAHPTELDPLAYLSADAVGTHWRADSAETRRWLSDLTDDELAADSPVEDRAGYPLWAYLLHVVLHGIEECEDATVLLRRAGHARAGSGFLDFWDSRITASGGEARDQRPTNVGAGSTPVTRPR